MRNDARHWIGRCICAAVFIAAIPACCFATSLPEMLAGIDAAASDVLTSTGVPSVSIAVVLNGELIDVKAYGVASLQPPRTALPTMRYSIGSISKQFTASLILLLVQDGKIQLSDPVGKYLPGLTRANEITLRQVLSMTSGYRDFWPEDYVTTPLLQPTTPDQILNRWGKMPLDFEPGTEWQYSNTNYVIAGRIVEIVGGAPLFDQLRARLFVPLKLSDVMDDDADPLPAGDAAAYFRHALAAPRPAPRLGRGWMFSAGELAMTARDLATWDIGLMNESVLSRSSYQMMFTSVKLKDGRETGYGLGVFIGAKEGHRSIFHGGEVSGFSANSIVFPDDKAAVVVLTNEDDSEAAELLSSRIEDLLLQTRSTISPTGLSDPLTTRSSSPLADQVYRMFTGLQEGKLDRSQLTPVCGDYFTNEAVDDFASSLKPLGVPDRFEAEYSTSRGGLTYSSFIFGFGQQRVRVTTFVEPDGKLRQFLVKAHRSD